MLVKDQNLKKRLLKRSNTKPKNLDELLKGLSAQNLKKTNESSMESNVTKKVQCKRLAGREMVIGNTVFSFNKEGICNFVPRYRVGEIEDFNLLIKRPGIKEIVEYQEQPRVYVEEYQEHVPTVMPVPPKYDIILDGQLSDVENYEESTVIEIDMVSDEVAPVVKKRKPRTPKFDTEEG